MSENLHRAIFVEACRDGWNPQSVVKHLVWDGDTVHEERTIFPSLREALEYAKEAFAAEDGPASAPAN